MKLVHSMPLTVRTPDLRAFQIVLAAVVLACAFFSLLYFALATRPVVEGVLAAMNAKFLSLAYGAPH